MIKPEKKNYWPETVYVSKDAAEDILTKRILSRLGNVKIVIHDDSDPLSGPNAFEPRSFTKAKRSLLLKRYRGNWLKSCPGTGQHVCCNLWIVNPGEGCPLDCTYCYLQSYLKRNPTLKLYTNIDEMLLAIEQKLKANSTRLFRIGTGELIDSLVWDELTDQTLELVPFFSRFENTTLELKTKTALVDNLVMLKNEHRQRTVVSWSVNAPTISKNDEAYTATLAQRIEAACRVIEAGYRVGFHFDPVCHFSGWQDEYRDTVRRIFTQIDTSRVAWVSVSTLRYRKDMHETMRIRFPESKIPYGEQFLAKDGKLRYIQPIRFGLVDFVWKELKAVSSQIPAYMCMETPAAWHEIAGGAPVSGTELREVFSRRTTLPVVSNAEI